MEDRSCCNPNGLTVRLGLAGEIELDPHLYREIETHKHCTVHVLQCIRCGHIEIEWEEEQINDE